MELGVPLNPPRQLVQRCTGHADGPCARLVDGTREQPSMVEDRLELLGNPLAFEVVVHRVFPSAFAAALLTYMSKAVLARSSESASRCPYTLSSCSTDVPMSRDRSNKLTPGTGLSARTHHWKDTGTTGHSRIESQTKSTAANLTNAPDGTSHTLTVPE